jgi:phosphatidate cytidylyltransferase
MQKFNNLTQRFFTAILGAAVLITCMVWNASTLIFAMWGLALLIHLEYLKTIQKLKKGETNHQEIILNVLVGQVIFFVVPAYYANSAYTNLLVLAILPCIMLVILFELFGKRDTPFQNIGLNIVGYFYCVLPFMLLLSIALIFLAKAPFMPDMPTYKQNSTYFILGYFLLVWTNDVMAYFTGMLFGKHKLFERISPKKTWEGFFGGFIFSIGMAFLVSRYLEFLSLANWMIIAAIISVFGTLGDLVESMLKRSLQLKDSSSVLPGHGGFLDRFDATLIAAPFVWFYIVAVIQY